MATFDGISVFDIITALPHGNDDIDDNAQEFDTLVGSDFEVSFGSLDENQPTTVETRPHDGVAIEYYAFLDFYNRIHIQYRTLNLGAVVNNQLVPFSIFNGYFIAHTLESITPGNAFGITLIEPGATPLVFGPLEEQIYYLQVGTVGPAAVDAGYIFEFDSETLSMSVVGIRVIAWKWEPNWVDPVRERLAWLSDVQISYNAKEQRRKLRAWPRQYYSFTFDIDKTDLQFFENALYAWGSRTFALPVWTDGQTLAGIVAQGSTIIPVNTTNSQFVAGEQLIFINGGDHEALQIAEVEADNVTVAQPTAVAWLPGTQVYPCRSAKLENVVELKRFIRSYGYGVANFRCDDGAIAGALDESGNLYLEYPVLEDEPDWGEDPGMSYARKQSVLDYEIGRVRIGDEGEIPWMLFLNNYKMMGRNEIFHMRAWLYARVGRVRACWVPTFAADMTLKGTISAAATSISVESCGLVAYAAANVNRRDIRIELVNGDIYYRRVGNPATDDATTESVDIDSPLGIEVTVDEVSRISWMALCRLDQDDIEIVWNGQLEAEMSVVMRSYRHDV